MTDTATESKLPYTKPELRFSLQEAHRAAFACLGTAATNVDKHPEMASEIRLAREFFVHLHGPRLLRLIEQVIEALGD